MASNKKSVLFVCLGNICRSPIAEAVFNHILKEKGDQEKWLADSAATGEWHINHGPDRRALKTMTNHSIDISHKARLVLREDFLRFDFILAMDNDNMRDLEVIKPSDSTATVELLGSYDPEGYLFVYDPYYDRGSEGFEKVYQHCLRCCQGFLEKHG